MRGLLADVNVQRHLQYLRQSLDALDLSLVLEEIGLHLATFRELGLDPSIDDRALWNYCQSEGWILFTENRNDDGPDSLQQTMNDSWFDGALPVLTLASKARFERSKDYARRVAEEISETMFDLAMKPDHRLPPRIYVPKRWP